MELGKVESESGPLGIGPSFRATNKVFLARRGEEYFVVKLPSAKTQLAYDYYTLQDRGFFGLREPCTPLEGMEREAERLYQLEGVNAPRLIGYSEENGIIGKEYIEGMPYSILLYGLEMHHEAALESLMGIHQRGVVVGNAHVKNLILKKRKGQGFDGYWVDFDGKFDESDLVKAQAVDVISFVYSAWSVARNERDEEVVKDIAQYVRRNYSNANNPGVMERVGELLSKRENDLPWWFATRIPRDGRLDARIKGILTK